MKKIVTGLILCLALAVSGAIAHHPAEDMVDDEIYANIDEMVADTPHATMVFDAVDETTTITADSVSEAEDLIDDGLLANLSLLEEDVTVTISFVEEAEPVEAASLTLDGSRKKERWTERDDWGRAVTFTIDIEIPCDLSCPED